VTAEPRALKNAQRKAWEANAPGWKKHRSVRAALAPVTDALVALADIGPGRWILDVATGIGDPALALARLVGPTGKVVGIDFAPAMIASAGERARADGIANASFHVLDVDELVGWPEAGYDTAVCRFGLAYLPELERGLRAIRHVLTPDAPLATAVWAPPDRVPFIQVAKDAIHHVLDVPGPGAGTPHAFALSERGVLEQALSSAGFARIRGERVTLVVELQSAEEYVEVMRETTRLDALVQSTAPDKTEAAWAAVAEATAPYRDASGKVLFPCEASCVVGFKA
jgi:ubiquinone/menaquinone biosynthesis C-methylase UbiE